MRVKLSGSWETVVGEQDTFCACLLGPPLPCADTASASVHILEYENYAGYDKSSALIRNSDVRTRTPLQSSIDTEPQPRHLLPIITPRPDNPHTQYHKAYQAILPYLTARETQLCQEFAFFPTAPPHTEGGIFELRRYQLKAGALLEWEQAWCVPTRSSICLSILAHH